MTLKIGIIGTNFISDDFCDAAAQVDGIELYACLLYTSPSPRDA